MKPISKRARVHSSSEDADEDASLPLAKKSSADNNNNTKPICKYGSSCYRKNPDHFREFRHPHLESTSTSTSTSTSCATSTTDSTAHDNHDDDDGDGRDENEEEQEEEEEEDLEEKKDEDEDDGHQVAFLTSPDGTEYWDIVRDSTSVRTSGGAMGYYAFNTDMGYDDVDQAKAKYTSWLEAKLRSGWIVTKDPRDLHDDRESVYLVANDNPPHWPHKRRWKLRVSGVKVYTTWADGGAWLDQGYGHPSRTFSRWYGTVAEARAQAEEWIRKKKDQGYHQVPEPTIYSSAGGKWDCPARDACPYLSHSEHLEYYHHKLGGVIDPQQLAASCQNPVLLEAWNMQHAPKYIKAIEQATPDHIKPLASIITEYLQPSFQSCWKPTCVEQKNVPITRSKIGGRPYIPKGEKWPTCGDCGDPLTFLVQLNLSELPREASCALGDPHHMIQLFICMNNDRECGDAYTAFAPGNLARRITWTEGGGQPTLVVPPSSTAHSIMYCAREKLITGWVEQIDRVSADDEWYTQLKMLQGEDEMYESWEDGDEALSIPDAACDGDKLCGYGRYWDGPVYPTCPKCTSDSNKSYPTRDRRKQKQKQKSDRDQGSEDGHADADSTPTPTPTPSAQPKHIMRYIFQVGGEDQIAPFIDVGTGHIYQCATHKDVLAFNWGES